MDATQALIDRIAGMGKTVKQAGNDRWIAQCPAHDDGRPSLSVARGRGQALLFCFAGCTADEVASAVGLRVDDLFDDPKGVDYQYRHEGKLVRTVHRSPAKQFAQSIVDKAHVVLYEPDGMNLATVIAAGNDVWIPEGEKDADNLVKFYGVAAVTSPMGASAWKRADWSALTGSSDLVVVADRDEPGMERAAGLAAHLAQFTSGAVRVVHPKVGKDATDHMVAGLPLTAFEPVEVAPAPFDSAFENAVEEERRYLSVKAEARKREADSALIAVGDKLAPKTLGEILDMETVHDWLVPDLFERRDRLMLTGGEGSGKSHLLRQIAITMAAGVHPFTREHIPTSKVVVVDAENTEQQWARGARYVTNMATRLGSGNPRADVIVNAGTRLDFTRPADVNEIHRLIDKHSPDVLYIGPLYKLVPKEISTDDDAAPLIVALDGFRERGVVLLMEAHAGHGKGVGGSRDLRPRGSAALLGWPEFGFGLAPVDDDDTMVSLSRWRGDRDQRDWPVRLRRGIEGELPWMPVWS